jgi:hypothetical protein
VKLNKDQQELARYVLVDYLKIAVNETRLEMLERESDKAHGDLPDAWELAELALSRMKHLGIIDFDDQPSAKDE